MSRRESMLTRLAMPAVDWALSALTRGFVQRRRDVWPPYIEARVGRPACRGRSQAEAGVHSEPGPVLSLLPRLSFTAAAVVNCDHW